MNLIADLEKILISKFINLGFKHPVSNIHDLLRAFFNLTDKSISIQKRKVYLSTELKNKQLPKPYGHYLKQVIQKFKEGQNLIPHLSIKAVKPHQKDLLLYDWGIHHLHLGDTLNPNGFIKRSDYILFFVLKENEVYLIDVTKHKLEDRTEFSQQQLLQILKNNWPFLLTPFQLKNITNLSKKFTDKELSIIRKNGGMALVEIDNIIFRSMGGGISTAKTNLDHTIRADKIVKILRTIEIDIISRKQIIETIATDYKLTLNPIDFNLILHEKNFYIIQSYSKQKIITLEGLHEIILRHLFDS
ncbi:hypothetical protein [Caryophanon tenue]|uniref:Uncharacterized protein n=1 Tax=Caryophanon tenue TaxID=33978 RepID=A0A1C0Y4X2_9BACL|nr:hypothetical protein [Caryophanon tenue]OCS82248.1 hypothetical protein A6M13_07375 [Caryophanon tenue]